MLLIDHMWVEMIYLADGFDYDRVVLVDAISILIHIQFDYRVQTVLVYDSDHVFTDKPHSRPQYSQRFIIFRTDLEGIQVVRDSAHNEIGLTRFYHEFFIVDTRINEEVKVGAEQKV
jgi:hypothetical protein